MQLYDFTTKKLLYEEPEAAGSPFKYVFDVPFTSKDTLTKPIRIGGRYFGYLPYQRLFIAPDWLRNAGNQTVTIELLISPGGRLAEFNIHLSGMLYSEFDVQPANEVLHVNLNAMAEEDKTFIPASKNGEPVSSRIVIAAQLLKWNKILLYR